MGTWARNAAKRFQETADTERKNEELELVRHYKTVAGAETLWEKLISFISEEARDLNRQMQREFFKVQGSQNETEVEAPTKRLTIELDLRTPAIDYRYQEPYPNTEVRDAGEYRFMLHDNTVSIVGQYDKETPLSIETVGGELLDPLVV